MKRGYIVFGLCLLAFVGVVLAANLGFKVTYALLGPEDSATGSNWVSLPYKPHASMASASAVFTYLGGAAKVTAVSRLDPTTGELVSYTGGPDDDFPVTAGEGVLIQMKETADFEIYGSHLPEQAVLLLGPEDGGAGNNVFAPPYHGQSTTASELLAELGTKAVSVGRWMRSSDGFVDYKGALGDTDFDLVRGEAYRVQVDATINFVPQTQY